MGRIHPDVEASHFTKFPEERAIFAQFLSSFDVTYAKRETVFGSDFSVFFLKPHSFMEETLGFEREVLLLYSKYRTLQPRAVQALDAIIARLPARGRVDAFVAFLVSEDEASEEWAKRYLAENPESRLLVGLNATELRNEKPHDYFIRRKLSGQLRQRDLFDYRLPLRKDLYFFGREDLLLDFRNAILRGENRGIFGLRKSGKTSLLFKLKRMVEDASEAKCFYYDCKFPPLRERSWTDLLSRISRDLRGDSPRTTKPAPAHPAEEFLETVSSAGGSTRLVLIFDEIEYISPFSTANPHWKDDFVPFWQTLWASQSEARSFSFIIAGVNPSVVEHDLVAEVHNPLFGIVPAEFLRGLEASELSRMLSSVGKKMGLKFDDGARDYLLTRYGGHPLLTRLACSSVHKAAELENTERPLRVTKELLLRDESARDADLSFYCRHVVSELATFYPDEYALLEKIASGQLADFYEFSALPEFTSHLTRYGLLGRDGVGRPAVTIPAVQRYVGLELAKKEGRKSILAVVSPASRKDWIRRRLSSIDGQFNALFRASKAASIEPLFGPNSFPDSHKFYAQREVENENTFSDFISTCFKCLVEPIENFGSSISKKKYLDTTVAKFYPAIHDSLRRIRIYRHERSHISLFDNASAELVSYLKRDLEGRTPAQVGDERWFVLQQCVLDSLLSDITAEVERYDG